MKPDNPAAAAGFVTAASEGRALKEFLEARHDRRLTRRQKRRGQVQRL